MMMKMQNHWMAVTVLSTVTVLTGCGLGGRMAGSGPQGWSGAEDNDTDTRQLAFVSNRDGNWEIYTMALDGSHQRNLTSHRGDDQGPAWSPDGKRVAFFSNRDGNGEIYVMNADGSHPVRLTRNSADDQWPSWSPDGRQILFVSYRDGNRELYRMKDDGTEQTNLTRTPEADETDRYWMPDGRSIIFVTDREGRNQIYRMNFDGTRPVPLSRTQASDGYPQPSPDGARIAFISDRTGTRDLYVMDADGGNQKPLLGTVSRSLCTAFSWSPDGRRIAFATEQDGNNEVYLMNADGTEQVNLTHSPTDEGVNKLSWSADGKHLSFSARQDDNWEIYRMDLPEGGQTRLTTAPGDDLDPKWRPDPYAHGGARLAALSADGGGPDAAPVSIPPITFERNRRISDYAEARYWTHTFSSGGHSLALLNDSLYAVWYDVRNGHADVYFARSLDRGRTFGPNRRVNDDGTKEVQYKPSIGLDADGNIYVAWRDGRDGNADIYFARSTDGGKTFSKNFKLNDDRGVAYQGNPTLAVSPGGRVAVGWSDARNGRDDIYLTVSTDRGRTFSANRQVNDDPEGTAHSHPTLAVDTAGIVYVAWEDFRRGHSDIYFAKSADSGKSFSPNRRVNDDAGDAPQISPSLAVGPSGEVYLAWGDFRNSSVTLAPPHSTTGEEQRWEDSRTGNADIYFSKSADGISFSANVRLNDDTGTAAQAFPSLSVNAQGVVAAAWEDFRRGDPDIYMVKSQDGGNRFAANRRVNDDAEATEQYHPSLALDSGGTAYVIWTDSRNNRFAGRGAGNDDEGDDVFFAKESAALAQK